MTAHSTLGHAHRSLYTRARDEGLLALSRLRNDSLISTLGRGGLASVWLLGSFEDSTLCPRGSKKPVGRRCPTGTGPAFHAEKRLELDLRRLAHCLGLDLEALALLELGAGHYVAGEGLDGVVVLKHAVVEAHARVADLVLGVRELGL